MRTCPACGKPRFILGFDPVYLIGHYCGCTLLLEVTITTTTGTMMHGWAGLPPAREPVPQAFQEAFSDEELAL